MTLAVLKQYIQAKELQKFGMSLANFSITSDAEARTLIQMLVSLHPWADAKPYLTSILDINTSAPAPSNYPPDVEYVYRGSGTPPSTVKLEGFKKYDGEEISIRTHQRRTGVSQYVSTSKSIEIAVEFSNQLRGPNNTTTSEAFVYRIKASGGIDCKKWFHPLREVHAEEQEVVFHREIPPEAVVAYCSPSDTAIFYSL